MTEISNIIVQIIKIKLDVKFSCIMNLESQGRILTHSNLYQNGAFIFNSSIQIHTKDRNISPFWEAYVVLKTNRGASYNSGILRLRYSDLLAMQVNYMRQVPIYKCYDTIANAQISVVRFEMSTLVSFSENQRFSFRRQVIEDKSYVNSESKNIANTNGNAEGFDYKEYEKLSIVDQMDSKYLKKKVEDLTKLLNQKSQRIRNLQNQYAKKCEIIDKSRVQVVRLDNKAGEKEQMIAHLENKLNILQKQLDQANLYISEKQEEFQFIQQQRWAELDKIREQYDCKYAAQLQQVRQSLVQREKINEELKREIQKKQKQVLQERTLNKEIKGQALKKQQQQKLKQEQLRYLKQQIIQFQNMQSRALKEKEEYASKIAHFQKQLQQCKATKKNYRLLEEQINILKKNAQKSVKLKQAIIDKITKQSKNKIDCLVNQVTELKNKLKTNEMKLKQTVEENAKVGEQVRMHEKRIHQSNCSLQEMKNRGVDAQTIVEQLYQRIKKLQQEKIQQNKASQTMQLQIKNLQSQNSTLKSELNKSKTQNQALCTQREALQYRYEKNSVEAAISLYKTQNFHSQCRSKQQSLMEDLKSLQLKYEEVDSQLIQNKNSNKELERLIHELRLQDSKNREQISGHCKRLQESQRSILKLQRQLKQKQLSLTNISSQKQKMMTELQEAKRKNYEMSIENISVHQKYLKANTLNEQYVRQRQQFENQVKQKAMAIQKLEMKQLETRKGMQEDKQKLIKAQNQVRIVRRQLQRHIFRTKAEIGQVIKLEEGCNNPVQSLISHHKTTMSKLQSDVNALLKELQALKNNFQLRNKQVEGLSSQLLYSNNEIKKRNSLLDQLNMETKSVYQNLATLTEEHNELLSIHQEYIFEFNRYKIDKEQELVGLRQNIKINKLRQLEAFQLKQKGQKQFEAKIKEINELRDEKLERDTRIKNMAKRIQFMQQNVLDVTTKYESQVIKSHKINNQLGLELQKNDELVLQVESIKRKLEQVDKQFNQCRHMLETTVKSKQKLGKQVIEQTQKIVKLEFENETLKLNVEGMESQKCSISTNLQQSKQLAKNLKVRIKLLEQQLASCQSVTKHYQQISTRQELQTKKMQEKVMETQKNHERQRQSMLQQNKELGSRCVAIQNKINQLEIQNSSLSSQLMIVQSNLQKTKQQKIKLQAEYQDKIKKIKEIVRQKQEIIRLLQVNLEEKVVVINNQEGQMREMQLEIAEKQQTIYSITGKSNQLELKWQNQEKRLKQLEASLNSQTEQNLKQAIQFYEKREKEIESQKSKMQQQWLNQEQQSYQKKLQIERLKVQIKEMEDQYREKVNFYEGQIARMNQSFQQRLKKVGQVELRKV